MEFHIMCGVPGCGKSTLAQKLAGYVVSTDSIRKFLWNDESTVKHDKLVFQFVDLIIDYVLSKGDDVVFDATNLRKDRRIKYIQLAKVHNANITVHWIDCPLAMAIHRNNNRERQVPIPVIKHLYKSFEAPEYEEGMDIIKIYNPDLTLRTQA